MREWPADVRISIRQLVKSPGFTLAAVAVLTLGIGLNAAMFSVLYTIGFMGRPFAEPDRLMQLYSSRTAEPDSYRPFSYPAYEAIAGQADLFGGVLAHNPTIVGVGDGSESRRSFAVVVSGNYFDVLGVAPIQGRTFTEEESRPGQDIPVVVASYAYWQRRNLDPALVGQTVRINERPYTVVGIMPRGFTGTMTTFGPELFFPLGVFDTVSNDFQGESGRTLQRADTYNLFLVGRLKDGVTAEATSARLATVAGGLERAYPAEYRDARLTMAPLPRFGTSTSPSDESALTVFSALMMGLTGAVLLTVCLNLASMLLARGSARRKEFSIRLALGGGRFRIVRQLLTEGFLLSIAGGVLGVALGLYAVEWLVGAFAAMLPITIVLEGTVSPALVTATILLCLLATVGFALGPALRHSGVDLLSDLKRHAGEDTQARRRRFAVKNPLLVSQVALSLALLIAAGLFIRMAHDATSVDFGFRADSTVLAEVDTTMAGYATPQALDVLAGVERQLSALPGVQVAAVGALVPLGTVNIEREVRRAGIHVPPGAAPATPEEGRAFDAPWNAVSGGYFEAMGLPLLSGRTFTDIESFSQDAPPVVVIDDTLARRLWPDGDALGQQVAFVEIASVRATASEPDFTVVGIVGSTHRDLFEKELPGAVYVPYSRRVAGGAWLHVRPRSPSATLVDEVRRTVRAAAPALPLFAVKTFETHMESSIEFWALRLSAGLFAAFGGLAMLIALLGIYGVMGYTVARRTREIGIRMAVGALPGAVRRMVLGESLSITLLGVGAGWVLGVGVGRVLDSVFVDVAAFDATVFTLVPAAFVAAGLLAAWLPARRATRVNPVTALRTE
ncbi:MAG: ABC transporter permease [Acidobacteriota bacterium]